MTKNVGRFTYRIDTLNLLTSVLNIEIDVHTLAVFFFYFIHFYTTTDWLYTLDKEDTVFYVINDIRRTRWFNGYSPPPFNPIVLSNQTTHWFYHKIKKKSVSLMQEAELRLVHVHIIYFSLDFSIPALSSEYLAMHFFYLNFSRIS